MKKIMCVIALLGLLFIAACAEIKTDQTGTGTGIANPASVFCEAHGGQLKMVEGEGGTQGFCILADGTECDEWAYYRGECPVAV